MLVSKLFTPKAPVATTTTVANPAPAAVTQTAPAAVPQTDPAPSKRTANKPAAKDRPTYVAPATPAEAKQRIETAIASKSVTQEQDGDNLLFFGNTRSLRDSFRLLGGEWHSDKDANQYYWSVPSTYYLDPTLAVATKSEHQQKREQREAEKAALPADSIAVIKERMAKLMAPIFTPEYIERLQSKIFEGII